MLGTQPQASPSFKLHYTLLISLILHLLIILTYLWMTKQKPPPSFQRSESSHHYVPAFTYSQNQTISSRALTKTRKAIDTKKTGEIALSPRRVRKNQNNTPRKSIWASSMEILHQNLLKSVTQKSDEEPVYLIGDMSQPATGIILVIAKSLSKYFTYPHSAGALGITGRVLIALTLHPDGHFSDVEMVKSSEHHDLDAAALYAVNSAPPVEGANRFITKPKRFVIGYIFSLNQTPNF